MLDRSHRPQARARRGISLFAILVSLCAVAVLAVVAIPAFFGRPEVTLENACSLLLRDIRTAQNRADTLQTGAVFRLHRDGWEATTPDGEPLVRPGAVDEIVRRFSENGVFEGVTIEHIDFGDDQSFAFDQHGIVLEGGSLELVFRGMRRRVTIDPLTGMTVAEDGHGAYAIQQAPRKGGSRP